MTQPSPPSPRRRRVVLDADAPTPFPSGDDERLARPVLPVTPPQPGPQTGPRMRWSGGSGTSSRSAPRARSRVFRMSLPRSRRLRTLVWVLIGLAVLAAVSLVALTVLLERRVS